MKKGISLFANMQNNRIKLGDAAVLYISPVSIIALTTVVVSLSINYLTPALAQEQQYISTLTGQGEIPPTNTKATGTAEFTLSGDGKTMSYLLNVQNINKVTMAEIHQGREGENGPVIVTLIQFKT